LKVETISGNCRAGAFHERCRGTKQKGLELFLLSLRL
jgi:hypothetical protein